MIGLLGSLIGGRGGRTLGRMIGGRNGAMIGGLLGSLVGSRQLGRLGRSVTGGGRRARSESDVHDGGDVLGDDEAQLLVRAMSNAAKADGDVDDDEAKRILGELGSDTTRAEREFLDAELTSPAISAEKLAAEVPPDLAAEVYAVSLLAIEVDTAAEHSYLADLAQALVIGPDDRRELHAELGVAPPLA